LGSARPARRPICSHLPLPFGNRTGPPSTEAWQQLELNFNPAMPPSGTPGAVAAATAPGKAATTQNGRQQGRRSPPPRGEVVKATDVAAAAKPDITLVKAAEEGVEVVWTAAAIVQGGSVGRAGAWLGVRVDSPALYPATTAAGYRGGS